MLRIQFPLSRKKNYLSTPPPSWVRLIFLRILKELNTLRRGPTTSSGVTPSVLAGSTYSLEFVNSFLKNNPLFLEKYPPPPWKYFFFSTSSKIIDILWKKLSPLKFVFAKAHSKHSKQPTMDREALAKLECKNCEI